MNSKRFYSSNNQSAHYIISNFSYISLNSNYISGTFAGNRAFSITSNPKSSTFNYLSFTFGQHSNNLLLL